MEQLRWNGCTIPTVWGLQLKCATQHPPRDLGTMLPAPSPGVACIDHSECRHCLSHLFSSLRWYSDCSLLCPGGWDGAIPCSSPFPCMPCWATGGRGGVMELFGPLSHWWATLPREWTGETMDGFPSGTAGRSEDFLCCWSENIGLVRAPFFFLAVTSVPATGDCWGFAATSGSTAVISANLLASSATDCLADPFFLQRDTCTYIHMYIHAYVHTYICTYIHTYVWTYVCIW